MEIPDKIYLQYSGDGDPDIEIKQPDQSDITWSVEQVFTHDIAYVRQSSFQELEAEIEKLKGTLNFAKKSIEEHLSEIPSARFPLLDSLRKIKEIK